jgi:DNA-3-methyladenine glycosylase II
VCGLLGLQIDLGPFYELAATDLRLSVLADRLRGLKPPRFPTLFEALVNAIACQQITLTFGIRVGLSHQKARAIVELARAITAEQLDLDALASLDNATVVRRLCQLRGVGRWTAEYALLRGLGRLEVFPGDDVGARNNLRRWLELPDSLEYAGVREAVAPWQSYAGLVYLHLLVDRLAAAGQVIP